MRQVMRAARRAEPGTIAVVCGAWHAPVLVPATFPTATSDTQLLKGLRSTKVAATWVPWTSGRLARASGYGAGIDSPGWYHHLFTAPGRRDHPLAGAGGPAAARRAARRVVGGGDRGGPAGARAGRAARPAAAGARRGDGVRAGGAVRRLAGADAAGVAQAAGRRHPRRGAGGHADGAAGPRPRGARASACGCGRARPSRRSTSTCAPSRTSGARKLLHRLLLLDVPWGSRPRSAARAGTFREAWTLEWRPELEVALIEASRLRHDDRAGGDRGGDAARGRRGRRRAGRAGGDHARRRPARGARDRAVRAGRTGRAPARHDPADGRGGADGPGAPVRQRAPRGHRAGAAGARRRDHPGRGRPAGRVRRAGRRRGGDRARAGGRGAARHRPARRGRTCAASGSGRWAWWPSSPACTGWSPAGPPGCCSTRRCST